MLYTVFQRLQYLGTNLPQKHCNIIFLMQLVFELLK